MALSKRNESARFQPCAYTITQINNETWTNLANYIIISPVTYLNNHQENRQALTSHKTTIKIKLPQSKPNDTRNKQTTNLFFSSKPNRQINSTRSSIKLNQKRDLLIILGLIYIFCNFAINRSGFMKGKY